MTRWGISCLALAALLMALLGYGVWQMLSGGAGEALLARIPVILGPLRLPPDPAGG